MNGRGTGPKRPKKKSGLSSRDQGMVRKVSVFGIYEKIYFSRGSSGLKNVPRQFFSNPGFIFEISKLRNVEMTKHEKVNFCCSSLNFLMGSQLGMCA